MSGNFIYRHHVELRVKLYSPREESFPIPHKYIDVSRTTHTNLDVKQERRIDDYWNIDGSRDSSDYWTGFTQFTLLEEKPPSGYMWSWERLTRKQQTSRPDHLWPELWEKMGKNAKLKERQKCSYEKPKLDNARKLMRTRNNSKKPLRMLERNWKHQWLPLCLARSARTVSMWGLVVNPMRSNLKFACILEASESTRLRVGESLPNHHEDHIAGKGYNSLQHYNLVHKFIPMLQAMKIPAGSSGQGVGNIGENFGVEPDESQK